jgi:capsule polysaccharide export protein KpsC/LpsZ
LPVTHELYVMHPADMDGKTLAFYRTIARIPGVRLIDYGVDSRRLVAGSDIVFTLTGTIGCEAALLGKPVITKQLLQPVTRRTPLRGASTAARVDFDGALS